LFARHIDWNYDLRVAKQHTMMKELASKNLPSKEKTHKKEKSVPKMISQKQFEAAKF